MKFQTDRNALCVLLCFVCSASRLIGAPISDGGQEERVGFASVELDGSSGASSGRAEVLLDRARSHAEKGEIESARRGIIDAERALSKIPNSSIKAEFLAHAGRTWEYVLASTNRPSSDWILEAWRTVDEARSIAEQIGDQRILAAVWRLFAVLYHSDSRIEEAIRCAGRSIFHAQQSQFAEIIYECEWQLARLYRSAGEIAQATSAYRRALRSLQTVRAEVLSRLGSESWFESRAGALFFEFADLLLRESARDRDSRPELLVEARQVIEALRSMELQDYFRDECADWWRSKLTKVVALPDRAAVIHLIVLNDRVELLLSIGSSMRRYEIGASPDEFARSAAELRRLLEKRTTFEFLPAARQLYAWLVEPVVDALDAAKVETLVWISDGAMRLVPVTSLQDGDRYLVERYAVAVAPGLTLLDPQPFRSRTIKLLAAGMSSGAGELGPLAHVTDELRSLQSIFGGRVLADRTFVASRLEEELQRGNYSLVHIATHAYFDRESKRSYFAARDGRFNLDDLERMIRPSRYRGRPIELLGLSACQTAVGDERAGLGLAGVALKSGARSVLATFWNVNDEATSVLIERFYRNLVEREGMSKAQALRHAQLELMQDSRYRHPCYWAPYVIIGNWL